MVRIILRDDDLNSNCSYEDSEIFNSAADVFDDMSKELVFKRGGKLAVDGATRGPHKALEEDDRIRLTLKAMGLDAKSIIDVEYKQKLIDASNEANDATKKRFLGHGNSR